MCGLTRAPLPAAGGCCHWNVPPVEAAQPVRPEMLVPLGWRGEPVEKLLVDLFVPYEKDGAGQLWIRPLRLALPEIFGEGTESVPVEELDWREWAEQWEA